MMDATDNEDLKELQNIVARCIARSGSILARIAGRPGNEQARASYLNQQYQSAAAEIQQDSTTFREKHAGAFLWRPNSDNLTVSQGLELARHYLPALDDGAKNEMLDALCEEKGVSPDSMRLTIISRLLRSRNLTVPTA